MRFFGKGPISFFWVLCICLVIFSLLVPPSFAWWGQGGRGRGRGGGYRGGLGGGRGRGRARGRIVRPSTKLLKTKHITRHGANPSNVADMIEHTARRKGNQQQFDVNRVPAWDTHLNDRKSVIANTPQFRHNFRNSEFRLGEVTSLGQHSTVEVIRRPVVGGRDRYWMTRPRSKTLNVKPYENTHSGKIDLHYVASGSSPPQYPRDRFASFSSPDAVLSSQTSGVNTPYNGP